MNCHSALPMTTPIFRLRRDIAALWRFCKSRVPVATNPRLRRGFALYGVDALRHAYRAIHLPLVLRVIELVHLNLRSCLLAAVLLLSMPGTAAASADEDLQGSLIAMRAIDEQVARIGHRLAVANVDLCQDLQWLPGFAVHDLSQYGGPYRESAIRAFHLGTLPAVLAVPPGGPAERAGLHADDALRSLDGRPLPEGERQATGSFERMEAILDAIEQAFSDGAAQVDIRRGGSESTLHIQAERGCASRFQIIPSRRLNALADGKYVQLTTAIADYAQDEQELAAILAHEFAHNVLAHRRRLDAASVDRGFFGSFGRNARLIRETEIEADRLSVYLLERAGYDPEAPVRFWSRYGRHGLNFLGSSTHPNPRRRLELFRTEIEAIRRARAAGAVPMPDFLPASAARTG